ncbi:hypothetical protein G6F59_015577 [Rhizopus arrhizus]|nr:hypothetical protein G6F59_015577 [Rhizopus arrhizus]
MFSMTLRADPRVPDGVAALRHAHRTARDRALHRAFGVDAALHIDATANAPAVPLGGQLIGRPELEDVLGREGAERRAAVLRILQIARGVEGVAARHFPARRQPAGYFRLEALAAHLPAGLVAAVADFRIVGVALRAVAFGDAEQRERGVQAPVQPFALHAGFVVRPHHGRQRTAVGGA